ncbi:hypothetical protein AALO_G00302160 [Alosa alosa]|uniref:Uncharacterized protein n=1 Tax=Alosa alosa TaxID=278164 RepID=A0AAV6FES0_9TELE|nr:hypothetical protein AALO_G00302160 [Alosa alosa]
MCTCGRRRTSTLGAVTAENVEDRVTARPIFKPVDAPLAEGQQSRTAVPSRDTEGKELPPTFMYSLRSNH